MGVNIVNGRTIIGNNIVVRNGQVWVDGKLESKEDEKIINITVTGDIEELTVDYAQSVVVHGAVGKARTSSGNLEIDGDVNGDVQASSGDITIEGAVGGSVETSSGDVDIRGAVGGSVRKTSGDIKHRK